MIFVDYVTSQLTQLHPGLVGLLTVQQIAHPSSTAAPALRCYSADNKLYRCYVGRPAECPCSGSGVCILPTAAAGGMMLGTADIIISCTTSVE